MDEDCKCYQATPAKDLEDYIMNSNIPKNEQEWWARRRILELKEVNSKLASIAIEKPPYKADLIQALEDLRKQMKEYENRDLELLEKILMI